jgi:hypothetical protein
MAERQDAARDSTVCNLPLCHGTWRTIAPRMQAETGTAGNADRSAE